MPAAGILDWIMSKYYRPILHNSKSPKTSWSLFLEYIKDIGQRKYQWGHQPATRMEGAPYPLGAPPTLWAPWLASGAHLWLYGLFHPGKNLKEAFGTKRRRLEVELGQKQSRALVERLCRGNFPSEGGN